MTSPPRMLLVLSENWTPTGGRADLPMAVQWAREAEDAVFDSVMVSEHIVLGPDAADDGIMGNPRYYARPGNQAPYTPLTQLPCPSSPPSPSACGSPPRPSSLHCATPS